MLQFAEAVSLWSKDTFSNVILWTEFSKKEIQYLIKIIEILEQHEKVIDFWIYCKE